MLGDASCARQCCVPDARSSALRTRAALRSRTVTERVLLACSVSVCVFTSFLSPGGHFLRLLESLRPTGGPPSGPEERRSALLKGEEHTLFWNYRVTVNHH